MADYIRTIPQERFDMDRYRSNDRQTHECDSIGCVVGYCTILDDVNNIPKYSDGDIDFEKWSENFTGLGWWSGTWHWCFSSYWKQIDNTPTGAAQRIEWLLNNGLPQNWSNQLEGTDPLIYKQAK